MVRAIGGKVRDPSGNPSRRVIGIRVTDAENGIGDELGGYITHEGIVCREALQLPLHEFVARRAPAGHRRRRSCTVKNDTFELCEEWWNR
jgi:hypothetical protein